MSHVFRAILVLLICFSSELKLLAQSGIGNSTDTTNTVVFQVAKKEFPVSIDPDTSILWISRTNHFKINIGDEGTIDRVTIDNGRVYRLDSSHFDFVVKEGASAVVSVYRRLPKGKSKLAATHKYDIRRVPNPVVYVAGVRSDSVIDRQQLIDNGRVKAKIEGFEKQFPVRVVSFRMISYNGTNIDTLQARNNSLTIPMRRSIHRLNPGSVLYFDEVKCIGEDGKMYTARPAQVFLDETNQFKVGNRELPAEPE